MVTTCVAYKCSYRHKKGSNISLYRFPREEERRRQWINAIKRKQWSPSSSSRICGQHFQTGKPSKDKNHPDYVPNVFVFTKKKKSAEVYERRKAAVEKRRKAKAKSEANKAAEALILMAENSRLLPDRDDTAAESSLLLAEDSRVLPDIDVAESLLLLAEDSRVLLNRDVAESLLLLAEGHQTEHVQNEDPSIEPWKRTQSLNYEERKELEDLRKKVKEYERKISVLEAEKSELKTFMGCMDKEIKLLRNERNILKNTVLSLKPTDMILSSEKHLKLYTGLNSMDHFNWLLKVAENHVNSKYLSKDTQLLIVLMKLKLNLLSSDIACRFQISTTTVRRIFNTWIPLLGGRLLSCIKWPNRRALKKNCPPSFRNTEYSKTTCIIDCTEVAIQRASTQTARAQTWSHYKNSQTVKFLVATAPAGNICFISRAWGGRTSDKEITLKCGFMEKISSGDQIMGDRGFILEDYFKEKGAKLMVPSFTRGRKQLSKYEIMYSKKIANLRIHVERIIRQIKRFRILQNKIPINFVRHIDNIIIICAVLSNLCPSVVS